MNSVSMETMSRKYRKHTTSSRLHEKFLIMETLGIRANYHLIREHDINVDLLKRIDAKHPRYNLLRQFNM